MNKEEKEDNYWKGYIEKQKEAEEICKMCKYRKKYRKLIEKESILDKVTDKLKDFKKLLKQDGIYGYDKEINSILNIIEGEKK